MGFRFRKSFKIAPGIKFNVNKKSVGFTFGKRGAYFTVNSKGKRTTSIGIPGTGLSYTTSSGGKKSKRKNTVKQKTVNRVTSNTVKQQSVAKAVTNTNTNTVTSKTSVKNAPVILGAVFIVLGLLSGRIILLALGSLLIYLSWKDSKTQTQQAIKDETVQTENSESSITNEVQETNAETADKKEVDNKYVSDLLNTNTYFRQMEETIEIIRDSKNPDTVISRFDFLQKIYTNLLNISNSIPNWNDLNMHLEQVISDKNNYINASIKRALDDELVKIDQLKTEKGKINRLNRFFEKMKIIPDLPAENLIYINQLEQETQI